MRIQLDDPRREHSVGLLQRHLDFTASVPPGIRHALDVDGLAVPAISFWTVWDGDEPVGCLALKQLDDRSGEIKSMHVVRERRGQGIADTMMKHLIDEAKARGYRWIALETGSTDGYVPARRLYARHGFGVCDPFAEYSEDPMSTYMRLDTAAASDSALTLEFRRDDPTSAQARKLLNAHLQHAFASSPPESVFALDSSGLSAPDIAFWTGWIGDACAGCGALRTHPDDQFEIKSMHTAADHRGKGVAARLLDHLVDQARTAGGRVVLLETGSMEAYAAARRLYERAGFSYCGRFGEYEDDPHSAFMRLDLTR